MGVWDGRRVLVSGARGFIGSHLTRRLLADGAHVYGVSRQTVHDDGHGVCWIQADLTSETAIRRVLDHACPSHVFHLAGCVTGVPHLQQVGPTFVQNLASTVHLLTGLAERRDCRVVLAGSMHEPPPDDPMAVPCSPYAASKWACSAYARMFHGLYGLPVVTARTFMVYGPAQWDRTKLLPYVITSFLKGEVPKVSSGTRLFDWVYVDDVVDAYLAIASSPFCDGRAIDVGSGQLISIRSMIESVARALGSSQSAEYGAVADRPLERARQADVEDTRRLTGWSPSTTLHDGLTRTVAWYRTQGIPSE